MEQLEYHIYPPQRLFIDSDADEILYGGAAGGGKTFAQVLDALLYALKYPSSEQIIFRKTYKELEQSVIEEAFRQYPRRYYKYNKSEHKFSFVNGSVIYASYLARDSDVHKFQSAQFDVIRFDELTHFSEQVYAYMATRNRRASPYPKSIKSSTNPGGIGHDFVKRFFIDPAPAGKKWDYVDEMGYTHSRIYIPARLTDNRYLLQYQPDYAKKFAGLSENERRALLDGDWDVYSGQYFSEWRRELHVIKPYTIPQDVDRYVTIDYGMDMLAALWIAVDRTGRAVVYREFLSGRDNEHEGGRPLIISEAAEAIREHTYGEEITAYIAPPDLWNRRQERGESAAEIFAARGVPLVKADNDRVHGWLALREWLAPAKNEHGETQPMLQVFETCKGLTRAMPMLQYDRRNVSDVATEPHELTHAPDALRYFVASRPMPHAVRLEYSDDDRPDYDEQVINWLGNGG